MIGIQFNELADLITPDDLIRAKYPGGKSGVYALFARQDFPKVKVGKRYFITKTALISFFEGKYKS